MGNVIATEHVLVQAVRVADFEPAKAVEPRQRPLYHPPKPP
jgi:hypothetical protein